MSSPTHLATKDAATCAFARWPEFGADEIEAAADVLRSGKVNYWTGTHGREFEREFANFAGSRHAVALANGTVALDAVFEALELRKGDEVIVTPRSFVASASSVVRAGGIPVFVDLDRRTGNLDPTEVERRITPRTRAVVAVHLGGWPCDMDRLTSICGGAGIDLLEDCAQAHGAAWRENPVGGMGRLAAWSFCQDKIMTTAGEGGMVTTDDTELWSRIWSLKDHGKDFSAVYERDHPAGFRWLHETFGTNWRLTEIQSAIGRIQLTKMPDWHSRRTKNAETLMSAWSGLDALRVEVPHSQERHAYYKLYVYVVPEALKSGWSRDRIMAEVSEEGVPCFSGSCSEIYLEKAFVDAGLGPDARLPVAKELGETSLMFLVHPTLSTQAIERTSDVVLSTMQVATA